MSGPTAARVRGDRRRFGQLVAVVALMVGILALVGCSNDAETGDFSSVAEKQAAEAKHNAERSAQGNPLTMSKAQFMPWLTKAYEGSTWPSSYTLTADQLWDIQVEPLAAHDEVLTEQTATDAVDGMLICAWLLELTDGVQDGSDVDATIASIRSLTKTLADHHQSDLLQQVADDAELGDVEFASQYVKANRCDYSWRD